MTAITWLVVFSDPDPLPANAKRRDRLLYKLLRLLKPGFRHVYAMRRDPAINGWLIINVHSARFDPIIQLDQEVVAGDKTFPTYHALIDAMVVAGIARTVTVKQRDPATWTPRLPSCVGAIKHLLGVRAWHVWTPWQLYRHLGGGDG